VKFINMENIKMTCSLARKILTFGNLSVKKCCRSPIYRNCYCVLILKDIGKSLSEVKFQCKVVPWHCEIYDWLK
jgi:hypothetical protein